MSKLSDSSSNPFLVSLEHAFQNEKELYFVMEFMQGGDLRFHLTKRGLMTEGECRFYAAECVIMLESMHRQKIIYRDFKPDNVLLDSEGHVRLSDFGLAVQLEEKYHYVMKGNAGTSGYLAPEVWAGEFYGISPDVWSFGITCLLASELVRAADGSTLPAGDVRVGMMLAGENGPVKVTKAKSSTAQLPKTKKFYKVTMQEGEKAPESFIVTRDHIMTLRVNHNPSLMTSNDGKRDSLFWRMIDPDTLARADWGTRTYRASDENPDDTDDIKTDERDDKSVAAMHRSAVTQMMADADVGFLCVRSSGTLPMRRRWRTPSGNSRCCNPVMTCRLQRSASMSPRRIEFNFIRGRTLGVCTCQTARPRRSSRSRPRTSMHRRSCDRRRPSVVR
jgi:serine/threonine protein kinase